MKTKNTFTKLTAEEKAIKHIKGFSQMVSNSEIDLKEFHRLVINQLNKVDDINNSQWARNYNK